MTEKMTSLLKVRNAYNDITFNLEELIRNKLVDVKHLLSVKVMIRKFKSKIEKIDKEIQTIRKNCSHNFEFSCTGHKSNYYECTECGEDEER